MDCFAPLAMTGTERVERKPYHRRQSFARRPKQVLPEFAHSFSLAALMALRARRLPILSSQIRLFALRIDEQGVKRERLIEEIADHARAATLAFTGGREMAISGPMGRLWRRKGWRGGVLGVAEAKI